MKAEAGQMETQVSKAEKAKRPTRYHSKNDLADRYRVVVRTVDRWRVDGLFPEPDLILPNGAPRWSDELVIAHERAAVGKKGTP
jgi:hypothetical protein